MIVLQDPSADSIKKPVSETIISDETTIRVDSILDASFSGIRTQNRFYVWLSPIEVKAQVYFHVKFGEEDAPEMWIASEREMRIKLVLYMQRMPFNRLSECCKLQRAMTR